MAYVSIVSCIYIYKLNQEAVKYYTLDLTPFEFLDESHFAPLNHRYEYIPGYNFIWTIHKNNSSTRFNKYNITVLKTLEMIEDKIEIENIFKNFI